VEVLLGASVYAEILSTGKIKGPKGSPTAINSKFGWMLTGECEAKEALTCLHVCQVKSPKRRRNFYWKKRDRSGTDRKHNDDLDNCANTNVKKITNVFQGICDKGAYFVCSIMRMTMFVVLSLKLVVQWFCRSSYCELSDQPAKPCDNSSSMPVPIPTKMSPTKSEANQSFSKSKRKRLRRKQNSKLNKSRLTHPVLA